MPPLTFKHWCELTGRRWIGAASYDEFERNAKAYEEYLANHGPPVGTSGNPKEDE